MRFPIIFCSQRKKTASDCRVDKLAKFFATTKMSASGYQQGLFRRRNDLFVISDVILRSTQSPSIGRILNVAFDSMSKVGSSLEESGLIMLSCAKFVGGCIQKMGKIDEAISHVMWLSSLRNLLSKLLLHVAAHFFFLGWLWLAHNQGGLCYGFSCGNFHLFYIHSNNSKFTAWNLLYNPNFWNV